MFSDLPGSDGVNHASGNENEVQPCGLKFGSILAFGPIRLDPSVQSPWHRPQGTGIKTIRQASSGACGSALPHCLLLTGLRLYAEAPLPGLSAPFPRKQQTPQYMNSL